MKFLKKLYKILDSKQFLIIIGCLILSVFIWARFILKRLPRDIPFQLSLWSFISLSMIIIIYIYIIYRVMYPKIPTEFIKRLSVQISSIWKPLLLLNEFILLNKYTKKIAQYIISITNYIFSVKIIYFEELYTYLSCFIIPKVLMLISLIIDCFYYNQLYLIYSCIFVISIPLAIRYLLHCARKLKDQDIELLENYFIIEITSENMVYKPEDWDSEGHLKLGIPTYLMEPSEITYDSFGDEEFGGEKSEYKYLLISKFIQYQSDALGSNHKSFQYKILFHEERLDIIILSPGTKIHPISKEKCEKLLSFHIKNNILAESISSAQRYYAKMFKKIEIIINCLSVICWGYILIKSLPTLSFLEVLKTLQNMSRTLDEPFSGEIFGLSIMGTLMRTAGIRGSQLARQATPSTINTYATNRVHTPNPTTSSNEGLNNNPAIIFPRKYKKGVVVQHPEWVEDTCNKPNCSNKFCEEPCGEIVSSKSRGHFTHSEEERHNPRKIADKDFDNTPRALYVKPYETPHDSSGTSINASVDKQRSEMLVEFLKNIRDDRK